MNADMNVLIQNTIDLVADEYVLSYTPTIFRCDLYVGGECLYQNISVDEILDEWENLRRVNCFMRPILTNVQILGAVYANPNGGQLLIGVFDDSGWDYNSHIRRQPRGYMLFWKKEKQNEQPAA